MEVKKRKREEGEEVVSVHVRIEGGRERKRKEEEKIVYERVREGREYRGEKVWTRRRQEKRRKEGRKKMGRKGSQ